MLNESYNKRTWIPDETFVTVMGEIGILSMFFCPYPFRLNSTFVAWLVFQNMAASRLEKAKRAFVALLLSLARMYELADRAHFAGGRALGDPLGEIGILSMFFCP